MNLPQRPRRNRKSPLLREMIQENRVSINDFIAPLFVIDGDSTPEDIPSMPTIQRLPIPLLVEECLHLFNVGIKAVVLFPCTPPECKDLTGTYALHPENLIHRAIHAIKEQCPELLVITDVALDPYTSHGHDGILNEEGDVNNDPSVEILCKMAVMQAQAGADIVAPSDMMDGRVGAIRQALDAASFTHTNILAYSAKFASAYYGPFREAVGSDKKSSSGYLDKKTYQLNPANSREALREATLDSEEAADMLMVKPAGAYLDIISKIRENSLLPLAAYQVSGEFSQIHAAARLNWLDYISTRDESLLAIKRAGADIILTYFAKEIAQEIQGD